MAMVAVTVVAVVLLMAGAAFFQEEIGYFFQLQAWNPGKPGQTVTTFLSAGSEGTDAGMDAVESASCSLPGSRTMGGVWKSGRGLEQVIAG